MTASPELRDERCLLNDGSSDTGSSAASQDSRKAAKAAAQKPFLHKPLFLHITAANKMLYHGAQSKTSLPKSNYNPDNMQTIFRIC